MNTDLFCTLFETWAKEPMLEKKTVSVHGSNRSYFRLKGATKQCLLAHNRDLRENEAFFRLSSFFKSQGLPVPDIYLIHENRNLYLLQDLGKTTLYDFLCEKKLTARYQEETFSIYQRVIQNLLQFQFSEINQLDAYIFYPRAVFDEQSMLWDLQYFKYYFLKLAHIPFDEQYLEDSFQSLIQFLSEAEKDYFMYRDFQSRNIMLHDQKVYFIDYQGGRRGPLAYDLASLLYDAKAELPSDFREKLLEYYLDKLQKFTHIDRALFKKRFYGFVLIRIMQAMGAYGYRGFFEGKTHFLRSIDPALQNLRFLLKKELLPSGIPYLLEKLEELCASSFLENLSQPILDPKKLSISLCSFSFKKGYPYDTTGNGGGFVFDCRALPNPGRYPEYLNLTGKDAEVAHFLENQAEVSSFVSHSWKLIEQTVQAYLIRGFTHLSIGFGCTGGQHRSVYCAEEIYSRLSSYTDDCKIYLSHREFPELSKRKNGFV